MKMEIGYFEVISAVGFATAMGLVVLNIRMGITMNAMIEEMNEQLDELQLTDAETERLIYEIADLIDKRNRDDATRKESCGGVEFRQMVIGDRLVEAWESHECPFISTVMIRCNGKMKEMMEDKEFIRSVSRYATDSRDAYQRDREAAGGN